MQYNYKIRLPQPLQWLSSLPFIIFISSLFFSHAQFFTIATPFYLPFLAFVMVFFPKYKMSSIIGALTGALFLSVGQFLILSLQLILLLFFYKFHRNKELLLLYINASYIIGQCLWQLIYYAGSPPQSVIIAVAIEWLIVLICSILIIRVNMLWPFSFKQHLTEEQIAFYALFFAVIVLGMSDVQIGAFHLGIFTMHLIICAISYHFSTSRGLLFAVVLGLFTAVAELNFSSMIVVSIATSVTVIFLRKLPLFIVAVGSIVPSILFFLYDTTLPLDIVYFTSILIAAIVFYSASPQQNNLPQSIDDEEEEVVITPSKRENDARYTQFRSLLQLGYEMLSSTQQVKPTNDFETMQSIPKLCQQCVRYSYCFEKNENDMQSILDKWTTTKRQQKISDRLKVEQLIAKKCIKPNMLLEELTMMNLQERLLIHSMHGKQMLSLQMQDFLKYLEQELYNLENDRTRNYFVPLDEEKEQFRFKYDYQVFSKSKNRKDISGDSFYVFPLNDRFVCILLSDGMGHAKEASDISRRIVHYMQKLLKQSIEPMTAMHTIHYLFSMQFGQETFATLDVSLIDLQEGKYFCWKAGCMSTYIARSGEIFNVNSFSPPIGAIPQFYIEMCTQDLKSNDMIWIVSDGLFSIQESVSLQEETFKKLAMKASQNDMSLKASLYELMDFYEAHYPLTDDCTVIAIRIQHQVSKWQIVDPVTV